MIIVKYYEMLPINGKIIRNDIYELCDTNFRVHRILSADEADELTRNCKKIFSSNGRAIFQQ